MPTIRNVPASGIRIGDRLHSVDSWPVTRVQHDPETGDRVTTDRRGNVEYFDGAARVTVYRD